ncbi:hydantoinase B/oxoprolinase family protein [Defluviicoccus vanus]|uniref:Hydantoinase B/oxoprolinase family protein n=1 Tax=Defluviicoccus vanus TaxID=111831 RepID=A0A7H1MY05_9PROT|nr:hydantoinase B/oxoprolinase family protein [Defluviicoccus vanus]QNT68341.1 hydantoinase B/oxoprolinase family protein [Defluviicoccus vanus]
MKWHFWIDRGGTFTDVVARTPAGTIVTAKLLSHDPEHYEDAAVEAVRRLMGVAAGEPLPVAAIGAVKMGTTVATNALLERRGDRVVLAISRGFGDALRIGTQNRPQLFARHIVLPDLVYERVVEIDERLDAEGSILTPLDAATATARLQAAFDDGIRAIAIVLLHGYRHPAHEARLAAIAEAIGFTQISVSHRVSALMKLVSRGDTTVVDAYLSPILRRYVDQVSSRLRGDDGTAPPLMFMQSNGGLTGAALFQGKDAILSGPAGGVVGMIETARIAGFERVIGFDMGGTSTDVSHYDGSYERTLETQVAGVRITAPMLAIHTVAAGGGSILAFDGARFRVGPASAGAVPGPACYRRGGPLTVTDANVLLGRIQPQHFPRVFGPAADQPLDPGIVQSRFAALTKAINAATGSSRSSEAVADGFLTVAVENMAHAIKHISVQRGRDVGRYVLNCFGGAGGQHACRIADALGMTTVLIHPLAGVLSAYGMGLAQVRAIREHAVERVLSADLLPELAVIGDDLAAAAMAQAQHQGTDAASFHLERRLQLKYQGTDTPLTVDEADIAAMTAAFTDQHRQRFGFIMAERPLVVEAMVVEAIGSMARSEESATEPAADRPPRLPVEHVRAWFDTGWVKTPVFRRDDLATGDAIDGPAIVVEANATTVVECGWRAAMTPRRHLLLTRATPRPRRHAIGTAADPVLLEVFNSRFMAIAEQMGAVLANTAQSVNIKERLDFSCAVFDRNGGLVANAPHLPVHLGSMGDSIETVIRERAGRMRPGDVYVLNAPYNGGTHLPDITVITPVFDAADRELLFFVGCRGHHADVGGITPGSMPPHSRRIDEEGVLIDNEVLVDAGRFREEAMRTLLASGRWPSRNIEQNLADLRAQIAANACGVGELRRLVADVGLEVVEAYMRHVQANAEEQVRRVIDVLRDGHFAYEMDNGLVIRVAVRIDKAARAATIDFTGTSPQQDGNFNAPPAVCKAAVLYVFRTLVDDDIPLNAGCLKPLRIILPTGSMLAPRHPAAVVAGNVETSQVITDALFGAMRVMAAAQGTMNNFTFGDARHQYYETICGGSGAGPGFDGTSAVHTHMTNTRITDAEVLEWRFPVLVRAFAIRRGSGGDGQFHGGDGVIRRIEFRRPMTASILTNHRRIAPFGLEGGEPGQPGRNAVERADGSHEELAATAQIEVGPGDTLVIETPGGGGYGRPKTYWRSTGKLPANFHKGRNIHVWTALRWQGFSCEICGVGRCDHVFGLVMRRVHGRRP